MRDLIELQSGQVAFISGLMSGFALSVAAHVLRYGLRSLAAQLAFVGLLSASLLFLIALYVDVRLAIEMAGRTSVTPVVAEQLMQIRGMGTASATIALVLFVWSIGLLGWLATTGTGIMSMLLAAATLAALWYVTGRINHIKALLSAAAPLIWPMA